MRSACSKHLGNTVGLMHHAGDQRCMLPTLCLPESSPIMKPQAASSAGTSSFLDVPASNDTHVHY